MTIQYFLETGYTEEELLENDIARKFVQGLSKRQPYIRKVTNNSKYDYAVIDGFNKPNKGLIKCINLTENIKQIVFVSEGYRKPFNTLKEAEDDLKYIKRVDPLRYKEFKYSKAGKQVFTHRLYTLNGKPSRVNKKTKILSKYFELVPKWNKPTLCT